MFAEAEHKNEEERQQIRVGRAGVAGLSLDIGGLHVTAEAAEQGGVPDLMEDKPKKAKKQPAHLLADIQQAPQVISQSQLIFFAPQY